jgi:predicted transcriptional regulator
MKKTNAIAALLTSQLIPALVFDEAAQTVEEIATAAGIVRQTADVKIRKLLAAGQVERVWKRGRIRPVPAYRVVVNR